MNKYAALFLMGFAALLFLFIPPAESQSQNSGFALPPGVKSPSDNPSSPEKIALGRLLFWDPILSGNKDVACASCHHPRFGYAEDRDLSIGVGGAGLGKNRQFTPPFTIPFVKRNSQTILNVGFNGMDKEGQYAPASAPMFWDRRATSLEAQALEPIKVFEEMRGNAYPEDRAVETIVTRLDAIPEYRALFSAAFGGENGVNAINLGKAISAFERSLLANNAPYDRYMRGERGAMTPAQLDGMRRFERVGCSKCHNGPMFSDYKPHVLGVPDNRKLPETDPGIKDTPYAFRTASLRNLAFTAPYMHNGVFETLRDVMDFYDDAPENPHVGRRQVDTLVLQLDDPDDEAAALIAFLDALNDDSFDKTIPQTVPSGLTPGGRIR